MYKGRTTARNLIIWQILLLFLSSLWLMAPQLNHLLSYRTSLISQYEVPVQPYSQLFRFGDLMGGLLIVLMSLFFIKNLRLRVAGYLLLVIGIGMALDPILTTTCQSVGDQCVEYFSFDFLLHATETVVTACAIFALAAYDGYIRHKLISIGFAAAQIVYFGLFLSQFATHAHFNTLSQFLYQLVILAWLAWYCRDVIQPEGNSLKKDWQSKFIKYAFAIWAFFNGILAIAVSVAHISVIGRIHGLYFAADSAWLAQHTAIVGIVMLYLSRHLARGERRARQIFLAITGIEVIKYSVLSPNMPLLITYTGTFCLLFVARDIFDIGTIPLTWRMRIRELIYMIAGLLLASLAALLLIDRDDRASRIAARTFENFQRYGWAERIEQKAHLPSVLLAHTISAFLIASVIVVLWILFRPYKKIQSKSGGTQFAETTLKQHSDSSEDFFKLWPADKSYYWADDKNGFIAYKSVGPIAFALADPVSETSHRQRNIEDFVTWARSLRLRACFLPVYESSREIYEKAGLTTMQIGSSAIVDIPQFIGQTSRDKWWRWQRNRAIKSGFRYAVSQPPHTKGLIDQMRRVSDAWLEKAGHQERGFALGYFDDEYLKQCVLHYLTDSDDRIIAFTNQLPAFRPNQTATIDLLRYMPDINNAMPYLLLSTIEQLKDDYKQFDLGFVPFAGVKNPALGIAKVLSASRFSSKGLEQFKNKFDPTWQPNYMAYDGDLADLALIAINLETAMDLKN